MLTERFDEALQLASELHREQTRKSTSIPYMSHLMAVCGLVLEGSADLHSPHGEDMAIAALLHDSVEDQGHQITLEEITRRFGSKVSEIVAECSDCVITEKDGHRPAWHERKKAYIEKIAHKSREALLVTCADKIHNARCIAADYDRIGGKVWKRFSASKRDIAWYYTGVRDALATAWPQNPLLSEYTMAVEKLVERVRK